MAEPFETLREVGQAIQGVKDQLNLYAKVFGGVVAIAVVVTGFLYNKMDRVEDATARIETRLSAIEGKLDKVVADAGFIRDNIRTADASGLKPTRSAFPGYVGVEMKSGELAAKVQTMESGEIPDEGAAWIYFPEK